MTDRERLIADVIARSRLQDARVWCYSSATGRGGSPRTAGEVKEEWDRICVEGDEQWTLLPRTSGPS